MKERAIHTFFVIASSTKIHYVLLTYECVEQILQQYYPYETVDRKHFLLSSFF